MFFSRGLLLGFYILRSDWVYLMGRWVSVFIQESGRLVFVCIRDVWYVHLLALVDVRADSY